MPLLQSIKQIGENTLGILEDVDIAVAHHGIAFLRQPAITSHVASAIDILAAVDLYDEFAPRANEVDDVRTDRRLSPEF